MRDHRASVVRCWLVSLTLAAITGCWDHTEPAKTPSGYSTVVDGVTVYLGVIPSAIHGGAEGRPGEHHVLISFFDARTGVRLTNMEVRAKVGELGMSAARKELEPMQIADTITYGNFFSMPSSSSRVSFS